METKLKSKYALLNFHIPSNTSDPASVAAMLPVIAAETTTPLAAKLSAPDSLADKEPEINTDPVAENESEPDSAAATEPITMTTPDALAESLPLSVAAKLPVTVLGGLPRYSCQLIYVTPLY